METTPELSIVLEMRQGWHVMILAGKFVVKTLSQVRKQFEEIEAELRPKVAMDLTGVIQLDSSAMTIILNFQKRLQEKNGHVVVIGPAEEIREMFSIVGFNKAVPMYSTLAQFEQSIGSK